ncbi:hypothetical protein [Acutalibacter muris]|uniref:hypothetical protein n=1 Tax=Acutalibacter muris TaxID=1796620 RepID=UPI002729A735|nr:hypothetical protein [Acutalibacter muris]
MKIRPSNTMKPILFNTEMVRAILDDRKTVTRRVLKPHNTRKAKRCEYLQGEGLWFDDEINEFDKDTHIKDYSISSCWIGTEIYIQKYASYRPGDILYVRETWCQPATHTFWYKADSSIQNVLWRPSVSMPREAARIFLRVTDVRVERLQDISDKDLLREGEVPYICADGTFDRKNTKTSFLGMWDATLKPKDRALYGWEANPWVWVIEFERCEKPEDAQNEID